MTDIDQCYSLEEANRKLLFDKYDYFFIDIMIPGGNVKEYIEGFLKLNKETIVIAISSVSDPFLIKEFFGFGIHAFISKSAGSHEIQLALESTSSGGKYISANLAGKLATAIYIRDSNNLTKKEMEILRMVAKGLTIAETAGQMHLSPHTVIGHRRNIMHKLGVRSAAEIVKYAYENKLC